MDKNRELHELLGLCWHEVTDTYPLDPSGSQHCNTCEEYITDKNPHENPNYTDSRLVLRKMVKREDWLIFSEKLWKCNESYCPQLILAYFIEGYVLDTTGKLRDIAIKWLKRKKEVNDGLY